jgi:hypothetical protein
MKINITITIALVCVSTFCMAQISDFDVTWSEKIEAKKTLVSDIFSTGDLSTFYSVNTAYRFGGSTTVLEKYENLKPVNEQELTIEVSRGDYLEQDVLELNNLLYAMEYHRTRESISLKAQYINQDDLSITNEKVDIYNFKLSKGRNKSYGEYRMAMSNSEQRVAFIVEHPGDDDSKSVATVKVFDDEFELKWKSKITLSSSKENTKLYSVDVSDQGMVHVLTKVYSEKKEREKDERNYEFYLLTVDESGILSEEKLELKSNYIHDIELRVTENGDIMCGGFYSKEGWTADGIFFMTLDGQSLEIKEYSIKEFEMDFLTSGLSQRQAAKKERKKDKGKEVGLTNVVFREIIQREDGGAVLVGEYVRIFTTTSTDANGNTSTTTHYYYDDIYVINIDPEGQIEWAKKIPKYQHSSNDRGFYSGFFSMVKDDKIHFMFNDHPDNAGEMDPQEITPYSRNLKYSSLMVVSMDSDGDYTREILVPADKKEGVRLRPKSCEQISEDEFILFAMSKKYNKFARVKVK